VVSQAGASNNSDDSQISRIHKLPLNSPITSAITLTLPNSYPPGAKKKGKAFPQSGMYHLFSSQSQHWDKYLTETLKDSYLTHLQFERYLIDAAQAKEI